jgi:D-threo-aldose 1-dehydrogenase
MKEITLAGTDITTTPLGFGCGGLMRTATQKGRQQLLATAWEHGVRHFDVARMYGLGQVESEVGKFLRGRRDQAIIATKFGIPVSQRTRRLRPLINVARRFIKLAPSLRNIARNNTSALYDERHYDAQSANASLEQSLSELGTDYIDLFLLHEPSPAHLDQTDVLEFLENAKDKGMIRAYGIAGYPEGCLPICKTLPALVGVLQIPNDIMHHQLDDFREVFTGPTITFSPFSNALERIVKYLEHNPEATEEWHNSTGCDCSSSSDISRYMLKYCLDSNPDGVVLCSTSRPERIPQFAQTVEGHLPGSNSIQTFARLARQLRDE